MSDVSEAAADGIVRKIAAKIVELADYRGVITPDTEVSYDAGVAGDDLDELLTWLEREFAVDLSTISAKDFPFNEPPPRFYTLLGKRKFKSMTVGALAQAAQAKRWPAA